MKAAATVGIAVAVGILAVAVGLWLGADWAEQRRAGTEPVAVQLQAGTALPQPRPLARFVLTDQDGSEMTEASLRGNWTFAAIGYTTCPDVCPMTMGTFVALQKQLGGTAAGQEPQFLLLSVDPERDTPERLSQYVRHFHRSFRGATGSTDALAGLTRDLGGIYARVEDPNSALGYTMDHSASIYLIDPDARLTAIFSAPHDPTTIARDYATLIRTSVPKT